MRPMPTVSSSPLVTHPSTHPPITFHPSTHPSITFHSSLHHISFIPPSHFIHPSITFHSTLHHISFIPPSHFILSFIYLSFILFSFKHPFFCSFIKSSFILPAIHIFICSFFHPSIKLLFIHQFLRLTIHPSIHPFTIGLFFFPPTTLSSTHHHPSSPADGSCYSVNPSDLTLKSELTGSDLDPVREVTADTYHVFTACRDGVIRKYQLL